MSKNITIASMIWGMSILLSRIIGLVREFFIGRILGGGQEADTFWTSFVIPDFLNYLLAGGALSIVFIPIFGYYISHDKEDEGWLAFSIIANTLLIVLVGCVFVFWFSVPSLVKIVAPGFQAEQFEKLITLTRIILPAQIFHVIGGLLSGVLLAKDKHIIPALAPIVYTSCVIIGGVIGGQSSGAYGFAWGVLVGSFLGPFLLPFLGCIATGLQWRFIIRLKHPDLLAYFVRSLPIMLAWSIIVVDDWYFRRFGSLIGEGAISTLQYAKTLMKVPMGVFGLAAGVAAYPTLTRLISLNKHSEAYQTLTKSVRHMLVLAFGAQIVLTISGPEIARIIYGNRLLLDQHRHIGIALGIMSIGLWAWAAQSSITRGFYAMKKTWIPPLLGTLIAIAAYPLYGFMKNLFGTMGLSAASTIAVTTYVIGLMFILKRYFPGVSGGYCMFFMRIIPAVVIGIASGFGMKNIIYWDNELFPGIIAGITGAIIYVLFAIILKVPELKSIGLHVFKRRFI